MSLYCRREVLRSVGSRGIRAVRTGGASGGADCGGALGSWKTCSLLPMLKPLASPPLTRLTS
jgi:hypothetical protein